MKVIGTQTEKDYIAEHGTSPQIGPKPLVDSPPEQRNDWIIPRETQVQITTRLLDMALPSGEEYKVLKPRERQMAVKVLTMFCDLSAAQNRLDRAGEAQGPTTDWDALYDTIEADAPRRIAERKRQKEEFDARAKAPPRGRNTALRKSHMKNLSRILATCYRDPDLFNSEILGRQPYWTRQTEAALSVASLPRHRRLFGQRGGQRLCGRGLDALVALDAQDSLVIVSAPSQALLGSVLWKELRRALDNAPVPLAAHVSSGMKTSPQVVDLGNGWCALGYSTDCVERASGQHAGNMLVVAEEASGLEPHAWEAIDSLKYQRMIAIGNPIRPDGRFVELIRQAERDALEGVPDEQRVNAIQIPSTDSPARRDGSQSRGPGRQDLAGGFVSTIRSQLALVRQPHRGADSRALARIVFSTKAGSTGRRVSRRPVLRQGDPRAGKPRMAIDLAEGVGRDHTCILVRDDLGILEVCSLEHVGLPRGGRDGPQVGDQVERAAQPDQLRQAGLRQGFRQSFGAGPDQRGDRIFGIGRPAAASRVREPAERSGVDACVIGWIPRGFLILGTRTLSRSRSIFRRGLVAFTARGIGGAGV